MLRKPKTFHYILIAAIALSLIILANAVISLYLLRENSIQERSSQLKNLTTILAEHAAQTMFSANTMLNSMVESIDLLKPETVDEYNSIASKEDAFLSISEKTKSNSIIDVTTFVSKTGKVLNFSRSFPAPAINLSDRDYFKYLTTHDTEDTFYSLPVQNKGNGKWVFYLAKRITNQQGELLGLALVGVSVEVFNAFYRSISENLGAGTGISLYRNDKTLLIRWPLAEDMIGQTNSNSLLQQAIDDPKQSEQIFFTSARSFSENKASDNRMLSFHEVKGYPLIIAASMTKELYLSSWFKNARGIIYASAASLLILSISAALLIRAYLQNTKIQYVANHDKLTGLPNLVLFQDRLHQAQSFAKRSQKKLALLYIDLDHFKNINDQHGHHVGDAVLQEISRRMLSCVRDSDTVSRMGGDEFVVLLYDIESPLTAMQKAEKIRAEIREDINFENKVYKIGCSIGIAIYPEHGTDEKTLKKNADIAMYLAKKTGRDNIQMFKNT